MKLESDQHGTTRLRFMQFAVEHVSDAVYWIREDGRIMQVNHSACQMLEYSEEELLQRHMYDLNPEVGRAGWKRIWSLLKEHKQRTFQSRHQARDGRIIPVEISANFFEFEGAEYSCAFARDISDRTQLELRLRQAEKMEAIGRLAGGVAHDFNNQLAVILGSAELLNELVINEPPRAELVEAILQCAHRSADLTSQLLAFSRQGKYVQTQVDLHELVNETCSMLSHGIDRRICVERNLTARYSLVSGDATQLQNAILNLALNGKDAMPDGGKLRFFTENVHLDAPFQVRHGLQASAGDHIRLQISDTGHGMDEATQERLFEPFFTTKDSGKGTGLGLAAVYGTVNHHRGAILVESKVGRGSTIEVYLPVLPFPNVAEVARPNPGITTPRPARVLLVEDESPVRVVTERMLTQLGCSVASFEDGPTAIEYYRRTFSEVDIVILDMVMPAMDGRETYLAMRQICPEIRAILASGFSLDRVAHSMMESGVRGFLQKPYGREALAQQISEILEEPSQAGSRP